MSVNTSFHFQQNSIRFSEADTLVYEEVHEIEWKTMKRKKAGEQNYLGFGALLIDVFFSLYKTVPKLISKEKMTPFYILNHECLEKFMKTAEFKELRSLTRLDAVTSMIATISFADALVKRMEENDELSKVLKFASWGIGALGHMERLTAKIKRQQLKIPAGKLGNGRSAKMLTNLLEEFDAVRSAGSKNGEELNRMLRVNQNSLNEFVEQAAKQGLDEICEIRSVIGAWGMSRYEFAQIPIEKKAEIVRELTGSNKLLELARKIGYFRNLAQAKYKHEQTGKWPEPQGIATLNKSSCLPGVEVFSGVSGISSQLYNHLVSGEFLQHSYIESENAARGPVVVLANVFNSIRQNRGATDQFIKAVAMGLKEVAVTHAREFAVVVFSDKDTLQVIEFEPEEFNTDKIINLCSHFKGGETNCEWPLRKGMELLQRSHHKQGELVLLTDGKSTVSQEFLHEFRKVKDEKDFKAFSLVINSEIQSLDNVKLFSDKVFVLSELSREASGGFDSFIHLVQEVKRLTGLPVMVSPGVVPDRVLRALIEAGADWYSCHQETYNRHLFSWLRIHQSYCQRYLSKRFAIQNGMLVEEGILTGVGETMSDLAISLKNILSLGAQQVRVRGCVPWGRNSKFFWQTRYRELKIIAILRLLFPNLLIPASLEIDGLQGLQAKLNAGANVIDSLIPPRLDFTGVAQNNKDNDESCMTVQGILPYLEQMDLDPAKAAEYVHWVQTQKSNKENTRSRLKGS